MEIFIGFAVVGLIIIAVRSISRSRGSGSVRTSRVKKSVNSSYSPSRSTQGTQKYTFTNALREKKTVTSADRKIYLDSVIFDGKTVDFISSCTNLSTLSLSHCENLSLLFGNVRKLPNIRMLELNHVDFNKYSIISRLASMTSLKEIVLSRCKMNKSEMDSLSTVNIQKLTLIKVSGIREDSFDQIKYSDSIEEIAVRDCNSGDGILQDVLSLPSLKSLAFVPNTSGLGKITYKTFSALLSTNIQEVNISVPRELVDLYAPKYFSNYIEYVDPKIENPPSQAVGYLRGMKTLKSGGMIFEGSYYDFLLTEVRERIALKEKEELEETQLKDKKNLSDKLIRGFQDRRAVQISLNGESRDSTFLADIHKIECSVNTNSGDIDPTRIGVYNRMDEEFQIVDVESISSAEITTEFFPLEEREIPEFEEFQSFLRRQSLNPIGSGTDFRFKFTFSDFLYYLESKTETVSSGRMFSDNSGPQNIAGHIAYWLLGLESDAESLGPSKKLTENQVFKIAFGFDSRVGSLIMISNNSMAFNSSLDSLKDFCRKFPTVADSRFQMDKLPSAWKGPPPKVRKAAETEAKTDSKVAVAVGTDGFRLADIGVTAEQFLSLVNKVLEEGNGVESLSENLHALDELLEDMGTEFVSKIDHRYNQIGGNSGHVYEWDDIDGWDSIFAISDSPTHRMLKNVVSQTNIEDIQVALKTGIEPLFKEFEENIVGGTGDYFAGWIEDYYSSRPELEESFDDEEDGPETFVEYVRGEVEYVRDEMDEVATSGWEEVMSGRSSRIDDQLTEISNQFRNLLNSDSVK